MLALVCMCVLLLCRNATEQWLLGESLLVSPVIKSDTYSIKPYFTAGAWCVPAALDVAGVCMCTCLHVDVRKCSMHDGEEPSKSGGGQLAQTVPQFPACGRVWCELTHTLLCCTVLQVQCLELHPPRQLRPVHQALGAHG